MKLVKIEKESYDDSDICCASNGKHYPYGTQLDLRDDMIDDLNIGGLTVGDVVEVKALAIVTGKSEHSRDDIERGAEINKNLTLQLTDLAVERGSTVDRVTQLYGKRDGE